MDKCKGFRKRSIWPARRLIYVFLKRIKVIVNFWPNLSLNDCYTLSSLILSPHEVTSLAAALCNIITTIWRVFYCEPFYFQLTLIQNMWPSSCLILNLFASKSPLMFSVRCPLGFLRAGLSENTLSDTKRQRDCAMSGKNKCNTLFVIPHLFICIYFSLTKRIVKLLFFFMSPGGLKCDNFWIHSHIKWKQNAMNYAKVRKYRKAVL